MSLSAIERESLAACAGALAHPHRLLLLDLLGTQSLNVEQLSLQSGLSAANTSRHLQILRRASLVEATRKGKQVFYALQDISEYAEIISSLRSVQNRHAANLCQLRADYLEARERLLPVSRDDLVTAMRDGQVTIIDVRPEAEYVHEHIIGALNIPLGQLAARLSELPSGRQIVAYCRGPHCILSFEAVAALQTLGYRARRLLDGPTEWARAGLTERAA